MKKVLIAIILCITLLSQLSCIAFAKFYDSYQMSIEEIPINNIPAIILDF